MVSVNKKKLSTVMGCLLAASPQLLLSQTASVEEVLVTARKRNEPVTDVAISLNVIDAATIESLHVRNLADLAPLAHNVTLFEDFPGAGIPTWIIRGVGLQDFNSNNTPAAAVYADGIYQVATVMGNQGLFDVAQVEVLKGPQGGLYGRNTTGGAVLLNSQRAVLGESQGSVALSHGSWQQSQGDGMVNLPLGDTAAIRLAGRIEDGNGGWQDSLATGEEHGAKERWDLRSWLGWELADDWTLNLKLQGGSEQSDIALGRSIGLYSKAGTGAFCAAVLAGQRDDTNCLNFAGVNRVAFGQPSLVENLSLQADDGSSVWSSTLNTQSNDYTGTLLELVWEGPSFNFKSLTAYDQYNYGVALDLDGSAGEYGHRLSSSDIEVFSQELQLLSGQQQDFTWLAGVSITDEDFIEKRDFNLRDNRIVGLGQGKLSYRQATESQAVYLDASYQLTDSWRLNGTARYTHENKEYRDGNFYRVMATPAYFVRNIAADYALDEHMSGSLAAEFTPSDTTLFYAKVSHGFKSGGFYGGFPFSAIEIKPYEAETLLAYEAGVKHTLPAYNLQLNAAVFSYDYRDVQGFVRTINPITGTGVDKLDNQADARHDGAELEVVWQPTAQWKLVAMLGWLDARLVDATLKTTNVARQQVLKEGQRAYAPRWSGNVQLEHIQTFAADRALQWSLAYQFMSEFAGAQTSLVDTAVNQLPGYGRLDASLTYRVAQSPWQWMLWSRNLTDKTYRTRVKGDGLESYVEFFGEPRSVGLTATYRY
ncbi:MAG: TonB-dependent receptor [Pseudomonadota bacterium]